MHACQIKSCCLIWLLLPALICLFLIIKFAMEITPPKNIRRAQPRILKQAVRLQIHYLRNDSFICLMELKSCIDSDESDEATAPSSVLREWRSQMDIGLLLTHVAPCARQRAPPPFLACRWPPPLGPLGAAFLKLPSAAPTVARSAAATHFSLAPRVAYLNFQARCLPVVCLKAASASYSSFWRGTRQTSQRAVLRLPTPSSRAPRRRYPHSVLVGGRSLNLELGGGSLLLSHLSADVQPPPMLLPWRPV
jgi:hypothetical protein